MATRLVGGPDQEFWSCSPILRPHTQDRPGPDAKLRWIAKSVAALLDELSYNNWNSRLGMPRIGCGIGGLDWIEVRMLLEVLGNEYAGQLVVFSL